MKSGEGGKDAFGNPGRSRRWDGTASLLFPLLGFLAFSAWEDSEVGGGKQPLGLVDLEKGEVGDGVGTWAGRSGCSLAPGGSLSKAV